MTHPDKNAKDKPARKPETVTCTHCRYERPFSGNQCPICGFPWPWMEAETPKKTKNAKRTAR